MNVSEFLRHHYACEPGYEWAVKNCKTMQDVWDTAKPVWLIWVATRQNVLDDIALRKFACFCARQVWHLMEYQRSKKAVIVAERFCDGKATAKELTAAWDAAWAAVLDAKWSVFSSAFTSAAWSAVSSASALATVRSVVSVAAKSAVWVAAKSAAAWAVAALAADARLAAPSDDVSDDVRSAAASAAELAALDEQVKWLRENCEPNFMLRGEK